MEDSFALVRISEQWDGEYFVKQWKSSGILSSCDNRIPATVIWLCTRETQDSDIGMQAASVISKSNAEYIVIYTTERSNNISVN